jgi:two-component system, NtrC family, nitrogen regulation sensor histidine kinase NtrY
VNDEERRISSPVALTFDRRVVLLAVVAAAPGIALALLLLWSGGYRWSATVAIGTGLTALCIFVAVRLRRTVVRPLQTLANLLSAIREDDFSIRARGAGGGDALGQVFLEVNSLVDTLRTERLGAQEATALLRAVMSEIDVAIFAFDSSGRLALVNRFAADLLGRPSSEILGAHVPDLGLGEQLLAPGVHELTFPGRSGRWDVRRRQFWQGGQPHELLVLSDVSRSLREEERQAWQRLIRVISHELNNSLAPIKSIAGSLLSLMTHPSPPLDWRDDMQRGLTVISTRAEALGRFTAAYAQLARLPSPRIVRTPLAPLLRRVTGLETRVEVVLEPGPEVDLQADPDQLEQLLINLLRNAADAALDTKGRVLVSWMARDGYVDVRVDDEGPGLPTRANLFVPFFTTKAGGSGIGLVLSRQIAEAHGGMLRLENRRDARGARATLTLQLFPAAIQAPRFLSVPLLLV